ncbi:hypothetical protein [Sphingomonas flavescens]|uniref:hypothetical protein n=1 Tax=Sphingomonas flavescens TaxID=3132797 RepID=UPI002804B994|nr:hypothetical protein [Sphingomonas limnosediminicola]
MILRFLNWQGVAGVAATICLAALLAVQVLQTRHWRDSSADFEKLYREEQANLAMTIADARAAADLARAADHANVTRVAAEQRAITERTNDDYEARLAAARATAERLRLSTPAAADPGARGATSVPGLPDRAGSAAQGTGEDRLPHSDALTATEQAIQLDELIKWVRAQAKVDNNAPAATNR